MSTKQKGQPRVMLHGRILYRDRDGNVSDVTDGNILGLTRMAEDGELAMHILSQCVKRLELLALAAEHRAHVDASLVRLTVEDACLELKHGGELPGYIRSTQELFANSTALPPEGGCETERREVMYQVCDAAPCGRLELIGRFQYPTPEEAERERREKWRDVPTAFLARVEVTRYEMPTVQDPLQPVCG